MWTCRGHVEFLTRKINLFFSHPNLESQLCHVLERNISFPSHIYVLIYHVFNVYLYRCRRAERSYSTFKVRRGGREKIPLVQVRSSGYALLEQP